MPEPSITDITETAQQMKAEADGLVRIWVVLQAERAGLVWDALNGSTLAARLISLTAQLANQIAQAPKRRPMLCGTCDRALRARGAGHSFAIALSASDDPKQAICLAICTHCAVTADEVSAQAHVALRGIWPELRTLAPTHSSGGHA